MAYPDVSLASWVRECLVLLLIRGAVRGVRLSQKGGLGVGGPPCFALLGQGHASSAQVERLGLAMAHHVAACNDMRADTNPHE